MATPNGTGFQTFLDLSNGIPSHDTFNRVFSAIDPQEFLNVFLAWTQSVRQAVPHEIVAMDGKALRRALDQDQNAKVIVSAWAEDNGLVLGNGRSTTKAMRSPRCLATLRRLALNLLKSEKTKKRGVRGKQLNASWDHAYLLRLIGNLDAFALGSGGRVLTCFGPFQLNRCP